MARSESRGRFGMSAIVTTTMFAPLMDATLHGFTVYKIVTKGISRQGGVRKDVTFVEVEADDSIYKQFDTEYRSKYRRYAASIIDSIINPEARSATLKLLPR